jgi:hypothetical protein
MEGLHDLQNARQETKSLLLVIQAVRLHTNVCAILQPSCRRQDLEEDDSALVLGLARLRQHVRIKIADTEDLRCVEKGMEEVCEFFDLLADMAQRDDGDACEMQLFQRLLNT